MKRVIVVLALSAIALFSLSCGGGNGGDGNGDEPFSYPHPDGGIWTYGVDVTTTAYIYTYQCEINGTYNHPTVGTVQRLDIYHYDSGTQHWDYSYTWYLLVTDNEVRCYYNDTDYHEIFLKLPPSIDQEWIFHSDDSDYTAKVVAQEDVSVPAGTFNNCYRVEYSHQGSAYGNIWYASGVGGYYGVQVWESGWYHTLSSYNLPS